jgi:lipoprotein-anchoring transpeptidase ErfK/SrfK
LLAACSSIQRDANFTARDRQELANPPYKQARIPPAYQRQVVQYNGKEPPGSILVDTDARYLYYVLPEGNAIRYGAIVGEDGQAPLARPQSVARKNGRDGRRPRIRRGGSARFRTISKAVRAIQWVREHYTFTPAARTRCIVSTAQISQYGLDMQSRRAASG